MSGLHLQRLGLLMEPEPGNPSEVEGTLNPAAARGPDGQLYLFPRLVAKGNYSRIGVARVKFNAAGDTCGVERLGFALEPMTDYERRADGSGGCEDPRVTFVPALRHYAMTYTALSPQGPRIAFAISEDLLHWERVGLAHFAPYHGIDFVHVDNKDASIFPVPLPNHAGKLQFAMLHRPLFPRTRPEEKLSETPHHCVDPNHESIWISYCPMPATGLAPRRSGLFNSHVRLAAPVMPWEMLKIGGGTPPILCRHGWLIIYHGVSHATGEGTEGRELRYSAGVMVLARHSPRFTRYRSPQPVMVPESAEELRGQISNVVFPTGIDRRDDLGQPDRFDVYYGMADSQIGVASLVIPKDLPTGAPAGAKRAPFDEVGVRGRTSISARWSRFAAASSTQESTAICWRSTPSCGRVKTVRSSSEVLAQRDAHTVRGIGGPLKAQIRARSAPARSKLFRCEAPPRGPL